MKGMYSIKLRKKRFSNPLEKNQNLLLKIFFFFNNNMLSDIILSKIDIANNVLFVISNFIDGTNTNSVKIEKICERYIVLIILY